MTGREEAVASWYPGNEARRDATAQTPHLRREPNSCRHAGERRRQSRPGTPATRVTWRHTAHSSSPHMGPSAAGSSGREGRQQSVESTPTHHLGTSIAPISLGGGVALGGRTLLEALPDSVGENSTSRGIGAASKNKSYSNRVKHVASEHGTNK